MTHIPEWLPFLVATLTTGGLLAVGRLLQRTRRTLRAVGAERDTAAAARRNAESERDAAVRRSAELDAAGAELLAETRHLVEERMPRLVTHLAHQHVAVPGLKHPALAGQEVDRLHRAALERLSAAVVAERDRVDQAAQAVMRGATTVIQAQSYRLQSRIERMQHRYDNADLAADLLELDLLNEQNLRRVQAAGVLCGATPGLTRSDSHLGDVVVGAQSRVPGYHRVQVTSQLDMPVAVVARAVEPIAVTVSELLANAVHHSHGTLSVDVSLHQAESGACVVIDDAGVGMHRDEIEFATRMLSGQHPLLLSELGDPPRSGFATIGRLVRQHGFSVSVDKPAPYGGVRAVVFIPGHLLTVLDQETRPMSAMAPPVDRRPVAEPRPSAALDAPAALDEPAALDAPAALDEPAAAGEPGAPGPMASPAEDPAVSLPRRRRRRPAAPNRVDHANPTNHVNHANPTNQGTQVDKLDQVDQAAAPEGAAEPENPEDTRATWAAFQSGTASGRAAAEHDPANGAAE
ncbi:sensor histidine kinase [Streptomyces sp. OF3]|uniref:histidine kinase n=1 Tax=Streptomyces alkaliterrae TaxID=2213162 RepID=A0A7W3WHN8_9ACTN|nr:sensor histidine kinase [Streptomyces alkaliterrae]MBB1252514.1 sensor histidine kinase [Streptomyces alkaliterrae]